MIKEIEFVLENLEFVSFPSNVIGTLEINDIGTRIARVACNAFEKYQKAEEFVIELYKEGNKEHERFSEKEPATWFERLTSFHDITSVIVRYQDNTEEEYFVAYATENDNTDENLYQKNYLSACGNLYIVVHPTKTIDNYFDVSRLDDEEHIEFLKGMYGIGEEEEEEEEEEEYETQNGR